MTRADRLTREDAQRIVAALDRERRIESARAAACDVPRKAPRPTYDPATDGNCFAWILKAARTVRLQEQAAAAGHQMRRAILARKAAPVFRDPQTGNLT